MNPPINAPTIPISIVTKMPPGSLPGMTSFAMMPTMSPKSIQPRTESMGMPPSRNLECRIDACR